MANRTPMVAITELDIQDALSASDVLVDPSTGLPYLTAADGAGLNSYPTLADAIADGANLTVGQVLIVAGGDNSGSGFPNNDRGIWQVTGPAPIDSAADFTLRLNISDKAAEVHIGDTAGFFGATDVEGALAEIGTKQIAYKRADTSLFSVSVSGSSSTAFDAAISALVLDNGSFTDSDGLGDSAVNGVIVNTIKAHKLPIRDAASNDAFTDGSNNEVYARLTNVAGTYTLSFYSDVAGTETPYTFASPTNIDLAYVWVSMDFMKLPPLAGVSEAEFFADQGGVVGVLDDANITVGPFTGLFSGLSTQEQVNLKADRLGSTANGDGASLISIEDAAGNFTSTEVEGALAELWTKIENHQVVRHYQTLAAAQTAAGLEQDWQLNDIIVVTGPAPTASERGMYKITGSAGAFAGADSADYTKIMDVTHTASELDIVDAGGNFTSTDVEGALAELAANMTSSKSVYDYASVAAAVAAQGTDAHKIGDYVIISGLSLSDAESGIYEVTALTGVAGNYTKILDKSNTATEVAVADAGGFYTATDVEGVLAEIAGLISNVNGTHSFNTLALAAAAANATWLIGDYVIVAGTVGAEAERGIWKITAQNATFPGSNVADYTKVLDITHTAAEIPIADAGGLFTAGNVEDALAELATGLNGSQYVHTYADLTSAAADQGPSEQKIGDLVIIAGGNPNEAERGVWEITAISGVVGNYTKVLDISHTASEVLISNGGGASFTGTGVQAALNELLAAIGGLNTTVRDYSSNNYVADNDNLVVAIGKLDAAIAALSSDKLVSTTYIAGEGIAVNTGPKLVSATGVASNVVNTVAGDTGTNVEVVGFASGSVALVATNAVPQVVSEGILGGFTGLTPGAPYYANPTTPGAITATVPSVVGQWIVPVGVAKSATELLVRVGEPTEIVPASKAIQRNVWFRNTGSAADEGLGETGFAVAVGDIWIDNDATVQNPTKSGLGRYSVYVCKQAWTGAGAALTSGNLGSYFQLVGKQN